VEASPYAGHVLEDAPQEVINIPKIKPMARITIRNFMILKYRMSIIEIQFALLILTLSYLQLLLSVHPRYQSNKPGISVYYMQHLLKLTVTRQQRFSQFFSLLISFILSKIENYPLYFDLYTALM
jgi:hypothetical protein